MASVEERKAALKNVRKHLELCITQLTAEIDMVDKELYDLQDKVFTVTDERSGRTFTLNRNSYELSKEYPKVHPVTGERAYRKQTYWYSHDNGKTYSMVSSIESNFPDQEFVDKERYEGYYKVHDDSEGWTLPGHYWHDVSGTFGPTEYAEREIPKKDEMPASKKPRKQRK